MSEDLCGQVHIVKEYPLRNKEPLFRQEVEKNGPARLYGDVHLFIPTSWKVVATVLLAIVASMVVVAFTVRFAKIVTISSTIVPDLGVSHLDAPRAGVLGLVRVRQGQFVRRGTVVAAIDTDQINEGGVSAQTRIDATLNNQLLALQQQSDASVGRSLIEGVRTESAQAMFAKARESLRRQIALQSNLIDQARVSLAKAQRLAERGFVTTTYLDALRESLLSKEQRMAELQTSLAEKQQSYEEQRLNLASAKFSARNDRAALDLQRQDVAGKIVNNGFAGRYGLVSPVTGTVANIRLQRGQAVAADALVMDIVPQGSTLLAALDVPSASAASVIVGSEVRIALDARPSQAYGTLVATIVRMTDTMSEPARGGVKAPTYTAYARIDRKRSPPGLLKVLRPDLAGSAFVVEGRSTLVGWIRQSFQDRRKL